MITMNETNKEIGIKSVCCNSDVSKYYNTRAPGKEEEFICIKCGKECDFYEVGSQETNKEWEVQFDEKIKDIFFPYGGDSYDFDAEAVKQFISQLLSQKDTEWKEKIEKEYIKYVLCKSYGKKYDGEIPFWEYKEKAEARDMQSWS